MTRAEWDQIWAIVTQEFSLYSTDKIRSECYRQRLSDHDALTIKKCVLRLLAQRPFRFPSIQAILSEAMIETCGVPTTAAAWNELRRLICNVGQYRQPVFSHSVIASAVEKLGGWADVCQTSLTHLRARFEELYTHDREVAIRDGNQFIDEREIETLAPSGDNDALLSLLEAPKERPRDVYARVQVIGFKESDGSTREACAIVQILDEGK
jgi:hypothetical protein